MTQKDQPTKKEILETVRLYTREKQTARRKRMKEEGWAFYALELPPDLAVKVKEIADKRRNKVIKTVVDLLYEAMERFEKEEGKKGRS